jgi:ankyrin repeat protein
MLQRYDEQAIRTSIISNILGVSDAEGISFEGIAVNDSNFIFEFIKKHSEEFLGYRTNAEPSGWMNTTELGWMTCSITAHAIGLAFFDNYLVYTNTGDKSYNYPGSFIIPISNENFDKIKSLFISTTTKPSSILETMLVGPITTFNEYSEIMQQMQIQLPEVYQLIKNPDEKSCIYLPQKPQKRGNCSKSNQLKNYKALILLQEAKKENRHNSIEEINEFYRENSSEITAKYKELSRHIREEALKYIDFSTPLPNQYILQHSSSQKYFYENAVKYILQKQLEYDGYTITQAENSLESKSEANNTVSVTLSDEQVGLFISDLKNNLNILTSAELNFQRHLFAKSIGLANNRDYVAEFKYDSLHNAIKRTSNSAGIKHLFFSSGSITEEDLLTKDEEGNTPLHTAIQKEDVGTVIVLTQYLSKKDGLLDRNLAITNNLGENPLEYRNTQGSFLLLTAIQTNKSVFKYLFNNIYLERDVKYLNIKDYRDMTLLHFATDNVDSELFDLLLEQKGIDVNIQEFLGTFTPLKIATQNRDYKKMRALLNANADPNLGNPLEIAVRLGDTAAINILLENGAKIYSDLSYGPLEIAINKNNLNIIKQLLATPNIEEKEESNEKKVLKGHSLLSAVLNKSYGPQETTVRRSIINLLLENQNTLNVSLQFDEFLIRHIHHMSIKEINILLEYGANINVQDQNGNSLLHLALKADEIDLDVIDILLENGIDINIKNKKQETPLCTIANSLFGLDIKTINHLLSNGANINDLNENLDSFLHCLISRYLMCYDVNITQLSNNKVLIKKSLNHQNAQGDTPLHVAVRNGKIEYVKLLLSHNAKTTIRNNDGKTCIDIARESLTRSDNSDFSNDNSSAILQLFEEDMKNNHNRMVQNYIDLILDFSSRSEAISNGEELCPYSELRPYDAKTWETIATEQYHLDPTSEEFQMFAKIISFPR